MSFVHLRTHTEFSVVDGTLRIDDAVAAARADGAGGAARSPTCATCSARSSSTRRAAAEGIKPIIGCDIWLEPEGSREAGQPPAAAGAERRRATCNLCELLARAWTGNTQRAQALVKWDWLDELGAGLLALVGRRRRRGRAGAAGRRRGARRAACAAPGGRCFRAASSSRCSAPAWPSDEAHVRAAVPLAARLALPVVATHPVQFAEPDDFEAHEARVCVAEGETLANPKRVKRFSREQYFKTQAQMEALFADLPLGAGQHAGGRAALQPAAHAGQAAAAGLPDAAGRRRPGADRGALPAGRVRRPRAAPGHAVPRCRRARPPAAALRRAPRVRDRDDREDGLSGLLPDRGRLHQLGQGQRLPGGPGPRLGRGLAGGVFAVDHRPRPAALQPAVRALPEPRAGVDARLRHRLLPGQPRARDRLRQGQVRPRCGEPDRHLRHHGREGRAARRRPRARHGLRPCRQHRQAGAGAAGQDGDAGTRARPSPTRA